MFNYDEWVTEQSKKVRSAVNRLAMSGIYSGVVYVMPSSGATPGELIVSTDLATVGCRVLRFPGVGDRVAAVPNSSLRQHIWNGCRNMPICPTE